MRAPCVSLLACLGLLATAQGDEFDKKIEALLAKRQTPGCAIAYSVNGQVRFVKGYGLANVEHKVKMTPESVHELASVSKQFTSTCILQLLEKGKLSLDDPISKFFDKPTESWSKVKIRNLLHHTGALPDYLEALQDPAKEVTDVQLVESIKDKPLRFEPGSRFEYSNSGYMILGLIVAKASGMKFGDYLAKNVFTPAGMKTAVFNDTLRVVPNRADGYTVRGGKVAREDFTSSSLSGTGDGEIMASALDLLTWDSALRAGKLLNKKTQDLMNEPSVPSKKSGNRTFRGYGFGVGVLNRDGKLVQHHTGGWMGTTTFLARYIADKKCLVILCNSDSAPMKELVEACEEHFLGMKIVSSP